ncbi:hypothetical protein [Adlercreutzia shanghongiae]|uniref:Vitamin B12 dependent methionine synthase n=1 Tax=Adlercreutzia shanghongiae TaxID=3111773 RepID=A0ABU6IZ94_9ACTN|nr:hypothetical protein [Adlercreutzia sp. R22]MEC4295197.1 hypothetical protein [Adlercreutzia sp. R22]
MELKARVKREEALAFLGHRGQELGDLRDRLNRAAALCETELVPRGVYRVVPARVAREILPGEDIARHLEGCDEVALMAVTLGAQSEMLLRREQALSATDGLLVDACASSLVEQAADALNALIAEEAAARGLAATPRFSPGYGDLPLSCQPAFLAACGADRALGMRATAANLLVPAKSITAVIGLYPQASSAWEGGLTSTPTEGAWDADAVAGVSAGMAAGASPEVIAGTPSFAEVSPLGGDFSRPSAPPADDVRKGGASLDTRCSTCPLAETCALRAQGRTCYGNPA